MKVIPGVVTVGLLACVVLHAECLVKKGPGPAQAKTAVTRSFSACPDRKDLLWHFEGVRITEPQPGHWVMNGVCVVDKAVEAANLTVTVWQCASASDCKKKMGTWRVGDACPHLEKQDQPYSEFFQHFHPAVRCPVKPGRYNISDAPVYGQMNPFVPASAGLYRGQVEAYDGSQCVLCVLGDVEIVQQSASRR